MKFYVYKILIQFQIINRKVPLIYSLHQIKDKMQILKMSASNSCLIFFLPKYYDRNFFSFFFLEMAKDTDGSSLITFNELSQR